jgi:hypothetical protein
MVRIAQRTAEETQLQRQETIDSHVIRTTTGKRGKERKNDQKQGRIRHKTKKTSKRRENSGNRAVAARKSITTKGREIKITNVKEREDYEGKRVLEEIKRNQGKLHPKEGLQGGITG